MVMCCTPEIDRENNAALLYAESAASMAARALSAVGAVCNMPMRAQALLRKIGHANSEEASCILETSLALLCSVLDMQSNCNICSAPQLQEISPCSDRDFFKEQEAVQGLHILLHICNENLHSEGFDVVDTVSLALAKNHGRCPARVALECAARVRGIRHRSQSSTGTMMTVKHM